MTRPIGWTEKEIRHAAETVDRSFVRVNVEYHQRFLAALGAVHPTAAREREREAWDASQAFMWGRSLAFKDACVSGRAAGNERDRIYPSLLPQSPPPLVLSTGTWTRYANKMWGVTNPEQVSMYERPVFRTATDARKLAEWLAEYGDDNERK